MLAIAVAHAGLPGCPGPSQDSGTSRDVVNRAGEGWANLKTVHPSIPPPAPPLSSFDLDSPRIQYELATGQ